MSPLWREEVHAFLAADRVAVRWRRRGRPAGPAFSEACRPAEGEPAWRAAAQLLRRWLTDNRVAGAAVSVVLSDQFLRFALLPWDDNLGRSAERNAHARRLFAAVHGDRAEGWEVCVSDAIGAANLACAVDGGLPAELRDMAAQASARLDSIQPLFAASYNAVRRELPGAGAWLAVLDHSRISLGYLASGAWRLIRSRRVSGEAGAALAQFLDEIVLSAEAAVEPAQVCVAGARSPNLAPPEGSAWRFRVLRPDVGRSPALALACTGAQ